MLMMISTFCLSLTTHFLSSELYTIRPNISQRGQKGRKRTRNTSRTVFKPLEILIGALSNQWRNLKKNTTGWNREKNTCKNIVIPCVAGLSEHLGRIFSKHNIMVHFKPKWTLRQRQTGPSWGPKQAQHTRVCSSEQDSAATYTSKIRVTFEDQGVYILEREDRWFKRWVKETIYPLS